MDSLFNPAVMLLKRLSVALLTLVLVGCSISTPNQQPVLKNTDQTLVDAHQQRLDSIFRWQLSARLAIIQRQPNERDGLYLDWRWQRQPDTRQQLRFSHPLKGQLATLTMLPEHAELTLEGERYQGDNAEQLLQRVLGARLPLDELSQWVLGKVTPTLNQRQFISGGRLAAASVTRANAERWSIQWFYGDAADPLPQQIQLQSAQLLIKIQMNEWQLTPSLTAQPVTQDANTL